MLSKYLSCENINTTKKNTETVLVLVLCACCNTKVQYKKHCISVANKLFEMRHSTNISQRRLTDHNSIHEEAKSSLNSGTAYYNVTQSFAFPGDI
jgi:hypothetical protein